MKNKNIEKALIILVVFIFITMGIIIYQRYNENVKPEKEEVIIDNYYNFEYLFNNDYIKVANTLEDFNNKNSDIYMYLDGKNILHIKNKNSLAKTNTKIEGLPDGEIKLYYNYLKDNCYEFAGLSETNLYYTNFCLNKKVLSFEKISTSVSEVYIPTISKPKIFIIDNKNFTSNFIINTTSNKMKYISSRDNILGIYEDIENLKPYFNYICFDKSSSICKKTMYYITFDNQITLNYNIEKTIKTDIGEPLIIQQLFATFELESKKEIDITDMTYEKLSSNYNYIFKLYILDQENDLYTIDMNNNTNKNKNEAVAILASEEKIKNITYNENQKGEITEVLILYENGKTKKINNDINKYIISSTIYDKENNK